MNRIFDGRLACLCVGVLALSASAFSAEDRPLGAHADEIAKAEFDKYCRQICGKTVEGAKFSVDASLDGVHDEYAVRSIDGGISFVGANGRALLYSVYDFLSRRCGCRWYWDGDAVPRADKVDVSGVDIREKSRFEYRAIRYFAHRGLTRFQAEHWGYEDWKKEIDWCVKNRLNTFMLRIGQDDLFQKAFPDVCPYPDPSKPIPETKGLKSGYDNRSLFWSLQYRGELRRKVLAYARERGLMHPEDFGTMSHWYSRTPYTFLNKMNPPFLPQEGGGYGHPTDRVWDIRDSKWLDAYWKLTQASIDNYGRPDLLHTIGIAERLCYTNRADNLKMKVDTLGILVKNALSHYPDSKILFAGWDFYHNWRVDEVGQLLKTLDPEKVLIWDYEADANNNTNFTEWDVIGKYPYTFGIFLTLEQGLDVRADYACIVKRQRMIKDDPMCKGYLLWPESSHTDQLCINYFTANSWKADKDDLDALLSDMCRSRYGRQAAKMKSLWEEVVPVSTNCDNCWYDNAGRYSFMFCLIPRDREKTVNRARSPERFKSVPGTLRALADVEWEGEFVKRDAIDLARTTADRLIMSLMVDPRGNAGKIADMMEKFKDLLALDTDYSLYESMNRLEAVEHISYPDFDKTLLSNALNAYCSSHQYEAFVGMHIPWWRRLAETGEMPPREFSLGVYDMHLRDLRPTMPRTRENYRRVMLELAASAASVFDK